MKTLCITFSLLLLNVLNAPVATAKPTVFRAFGVEMVFPAETVLETSWSKEHTLYMRSKAGNYTQSFHFGIIPKTTTIPEIAELKAPKDAVAQIVWYNAEHPAKMYYGQDGNFRNKSFIAHALISIDELHYLHITFKKGEQYFAETVKHVNQVLEKVQFPESTADGALQQPKLGNLHFNLYSHIDAHYTLGEEGAQPMLREGPNGQIFMLWPDVVENHHLTLLSTTGDVQQDYAFGTSELYDVVAHEDGFTVLLSHPTAVDGKNRYHHLYLEKYTYKQERQWQTHLMGVDEIKKIDDQRFAYWGMSSTRLVWSGEYYAVYFASYRKWPDLVTHQGDVFLTLLPDGTPMLEHDDYYAFNSTWDVSHSFAQELLFDGKAFFRLALGDAYPRAISIERSYPVLKEHYEWGKHKSMDASFSTFPGKVGDNYVYDTHFGPPILVNGKVLFAYDTELKINGVKDQNYGKSRCNDILLKTLDTATGKVEKAYRITQTPRFDEQCVSIAYLGHEQLLLKYRRINPRPKGTKQSLLYDGDWQEMLMLYDLSTKKVVKVSPLTYTYQGESTDKFSLSAERTPHCVTLGDYGSKNLCTPLFSHSNGNVYMAKFMLNGGGFQLVEISQ